MVIQANKPIRIDFGGRRIGTKFSKGGSIENPARPEVGDTLPLIDFFYEAIPSIINPIINSGNCSNCVTKNAVYIYNCVHFWVNFIISTLKHWNGWRANSFPTPDWGSLRLEDAGLAYR